jgi:hypothetical protein
LTDAEAYAYFYGYWPAGAKLKAKASIDAA